MVSNPQKRRYSVARPCMIYRNRTVHAILVFAPVSEMRRVLIRRVSSIAMSKKAALERTRRSIRERRRNLMTEDNLRASQRYIRASQRKLGGSVDNEKFGTVRPEHIRQFADDIHSWQKRLLHSH